MSGYTRFLPKPPIRHTKDEGMEEKKKKRKTIIERFMRKLRLKKI